MVFYKILLIACISRCVAAFPAREDINIPEIKISSPGEINSLNRQYSDTNADTDIEDTIKKVEELIKSNPNLPRLTRGEILDIIDNITKSDQEKLNISKNRDQKAIMLVMPYSPDGGDLQTLYTKPPVTKIVGDIPKPVETKKQTRTTKKPDVFYENKVPNDNIKVFTDYPKVYSSTQRPKNTQRTTSKQRITTTQKQQTSTEYSNKTSITYETTVKHYRRRKPTPTTPATVTIQPSFKPIQSQTFKPLKVEEITFRPILTQEQSKPIKVQETVTFKPLRKRTTKSPKLDRYPNHKYTDDDEPFIVHSTSVFPTEAPKPQSNQGINIISPPRFVSKPETPYKTSAKIEKPITKHRVTKPTTATTSSPVIIDGIQLPSDFQDVLKNLDLLLKNDPKYSSQYDSLTPLPKKPLTQENVKELLASIGAYQAPATSTSTVIPDVSIVANNLSPDMQNLLMSFGLLPDPNKKAEASVKHPVYVAPNSEVSADSYSSFKPLPAESDGNKEEGMEELLASYGLGTPKNGQRSQKAIAVTSSKNAVKPKINLDAVPDHLKSILKDISLKEADAVGAKKVEKQHVFNPAEPQYATTDEITRLNKLLDMIKQLEKLNGTNISDADLKKIDLDNLKNLVGSFNVPLDEQDEFNPVDYDTSIVKNAVKRQQSSTTVAPVYVAVTESTNVKNPSLAALEDSFGGPKNAVRDVVTTTTTETPKKTGFYYLVDWNTFLDIDNQKGKRVNLRFQPTIGDPKRFFNIAVP